MAQGKPRKTGEFFVYLYKSGEGCSNRKPTEKALAALAAWQGAYHRLSDESKERICEGLAVGRKKSVAWRKSEAGQAHLKKLAKIGKEALHRERTATCIECGCEFSTKSAKARACSRLCEQRNRRRRQAEERHGA